MEYLKRFFMAALLLTVAAAFLFVMAGLPAHFDKISVVVNEQTFLPQNVPEVLGATPAVLTFTIYSVPSLGPEFGSYRNGLCMKWSPPGDFTNHHNVAPWPWLATSPLYPLRT